MTPTERDEASYEYFVDNVWDDTHDPDAKVAWRQWLAEDEG